MFNFDPERYLAIQTGAVRVAQDVGSVVADRLDAGCDSVIFAGSGGAGLLMEHAAGVIAERSRIDVRVIRPAELMTLGSPVLGPSSLVVVPSRSGTTRESIEVVDYAHAAGAFVLGLVANEGTPVADSADRAFINFAEDDTSCESFYLQSLGVALSLLAHRGDWPDARTVLADLAALPDVLLAIKAAAEGRAEQVARHLAASPYHIITGAGSSWPEAHYYAMCILEEMQWITTRPVHAADFFHGTLELVDADASVVLMSNEDPTRPLLDRVEAFVRRYTEHVLVLDPASYETDGLSGATRSLISPVILACVLERVDAYLEHIREHPLTTRRYYNTVSY
ncbi:MAG TPA: SIS domain-containing protein [Mycobacteriales bacterium]|nr:SIS domain-containing protein [Mycobacteriales bacterium]